MTVTSMRTEVAITLALVVGILLAATTAARRSCLERWNGSGVAVRWSLRNGCQVLTPAGRWVHEAAIGPADLAPRDPPISGAPDATTQALLHPRPQEPQP